MNPASTATDRYARRFAQLREQGRHALIPFTLLGWPDAEASFEIIRTLVDAGASALELGLAFSDPAAHGPIIQQAATEVLASGFRVDDALALLRQVRTYDGEIPIGLLVYYNMILARGAERFFAELAEIGVDGVLVADLPPKSADELLPAARRHGIQLIFIISPLTDETRLRRIAEMAGGFLYVVSRLGITGVEARYDEALADLLSRARRLSNLPLCVGFGISQPEHIRRMRDLGADGCIVGSAILQRLAGKPQTEIRPELSGYVQALLGAGNP